MLSSAKTSLYSTARDLNAGVSNFKSSKTSLFDTELCCWITNLPNNALYSMLYTCLGSFTACLIVCCSCFPIIYCLEQFTSVDPVQANLSCGAMMLLVNNI